MELRRSQRSYDETPDSWFLAQFHSDASLRRGDYQACLSNWLNVFPREQLLLIQFSDISRRPQEVIHAVAEHIGLQVTPAANGDLLHQKVFASPPRPVRTHLKDAMMQIYRQKIGAFNTQIGEQWFDPDEWGDGDGC